jgi:hypothetical protein
MILQAACVLCTRSSDEQTQNYDWNCYGGVYMTGCLQLSLLAKQRCMHECTETNQYLNNVTLPLNAAQTEQAGISSAAGGRNAACLR